MWSVTGSGVVCDSCRVEKRSSASHCKSNIPWRSVAVAHVSEAITCTPSNGLFVISFTYPVRRIEGVSELYTLFRVTCRGAASNVVEVQKERQAAITIEHVVIRRNFNGKMD